MSLSCRNKRTDSCAEIRISPSNWREIFCRGKRFDTTVFSGCISTLDINPPRSKKKKKELADTPRIISTLNSDRISSVLNQSNIPMKNLPVVELIPNFESWLRIFFHPLAPKRLATLFSSPFAAKCAIQISKQNTILEEFNGLQSVKGLLEHVSEKELQLLFVQKLETQRNFCSSLIQTSQKTNLLIPRSNLASNDLENGLKENGFKVKSWIGYENAPKSVENLSVNSDDVLLLSSSSSAISWSQNELDVPNKFFAWELRQKIR